MLNTCYFKRKHTYIIHRQEHRKRVVSLPNVKHLLLQEKAGNFFIVVQPVVVANVPPPHVDGTVKEGGQEAGPAVCGQRQQSGSFEAVGLGAHHSLTLKGSAMNSLSL